MEAPDALRDVQNYYNEIDRPHVVISLLTSRRRALQENTDVRQQYFFIQ
jgi:hypothetical protein